MGGGGDDVSKSTELSPEILRGSKHCKRIFLSRDGRYFACNISLPGPWAWEYEWAMQGPWARETVRSRHADTHGAVIVRRQCVILQS